MFRRLKQAWETFVDPMPRDRAPVEWPKIIHVVVQLDIYGDPKQVHGVFSGSGKAVEYVAGRGHLRILEAELDRGLVPIGRPPPDPTTPETAQGLAVSSWKPRKQG